MTPVQQAKALINLFCQSYGIEPDDLRKRYGGNVARKIKGVRVDVMRYCLSHYLYIHTNLIQTEIAKMVGYGSPSSVAHSLTVTKDYLDSRDLITTCFYDRIKEMARLMKFKEKAA